MLKIRVENTHTWFSGYGDETELPGMIIERELPVITNFYWKGWLDELRFDHTFYYEYYPDLAKDYDYYQSMMNVYLVSDTGKILIARVVRTPIGENITRFGRCEGCPTTSQYHLIKKEGVA